jgi:hypothetical protein
MDVYNHKDALISNTRTSARIYDWPADVYILVYRRPIRKCGIITKEPAGERVAQSHTVYATPPSIMIVSPVT